MTRDGFDRDMEEYVKTGYDKVPEMARPAGLTHVSQYFVD